MSKINFVFGQVISFDSLPSNSIALDGAVQGPAIDASGRRFSFDHHAGCTRMVTLATCQQVVVALQLGLVVDEATEVMINDLDADTVLSVWLLQNPERVGEAKVRELVERVGLTDAHGPIYPPHSIHRELAPPYGSKDTQNLEMLEGFLAKVSAYADGTWQEPPARPARTSKGFGWSPKTGWTAVESSTGFDGVYSQGFLAGFLYEDGPAGTRAYTLAKRSDLVPLAIGPGSTKRPATSPEDYVLGTILGQLALAEVEANPELPHASNWGGGTSIGGAPRLPDGSRSRLTPEQVLQVCERFTGPPAVIAVCEDGVTEVR